MRKLPAVVIAALVALGATASPAAAAIRVGDNWFSPKQLTVAQHSTVTWRFVGDRTHKVKVTRGPERFSSPARSSGRYRHHMMKTGTYRIVCALHPEKMKLTLTVE